ncbi:TRAP transporter large permease [Chelativorans sp. Marseille-P2723]|uniref:TRAP transporter large permease n=1 Tax=Chelativorans sp. Marseille-P2723 TaxID=2709133 RepID=UPI00156DADF6|nr:TRAP transporter large permease [Chelativorans sp. Marseille-P2723]
MDPSLLSSLTVGVTFIGALCLGLPIAVTLLLSSAVGIYMLRGWNVMTNAIVGMPYSQTADYGFIIIPLFILIGHLAERSGISQGAFSLAYRWVGGVRGGLGITTILASALFSATSGSSVATSATVGRIALKEMRRYNYSDVISSGTIGAGGLLGLMIPPSTMMVIYGLVTQVDIIKLFIAGILPGILTTLVFSLGIYTIAILRPELMPRAPVRFTLREKLAGLKDSWGIIVLFGVLMGGIYGGYFTVTEASAAGAATAAALLFIRKGFAWRELFSGGRQTAKATAMIFFILIGAGVFSRYVAMSGLANDLSHFIASLEMSRWVILVAIISVYIPLGMFLEPISMVLITMPIVFPVIVNLGFDPIWFGILIVKVSELANISPPIGVNIFVLRTVDKSLSLSTIYKGMGLFVLLEIVTLILLIAFPQISLFLVDWMWAR